MDVSRTARRADTLRLEAAEDAGPTYRVSAYTVYPSGYDRVEVEERERWRISVVETGQGWAVRWHDRCLSFRNAWEPEPASWAHTSAFLTRCRFSEHAAVQRARAVVDELVVDGRTYDEFVEHVRRQTADPGTVNRSAAPPVGARSALTEPPCRSATWRTIDRPSPEPGMVRAVVDR